MLSFITFKDATEQLEIVADENGLIELISLLKEVMKTKDHFHLTEGVEIDSYPIEGNRRGKSISAKHVRIEFQNTTTWLKNAE